ncbi:MAG: methylated-DNA--[protein]-cysteine S-methyltransferase [Firmicutes bacterium]|nr:methylated-DNA--[protein]-cysteine S-methyltransferase [Bacillota bacterium]MDH7495988.1 methylated-DNA--[protein]-cysteine S-methyltransferase [Bacillota bacterium]
MDSPSTKCCRVERVFYSVAESPVGVLRLASSIDGLVKVSLPAEGETGFLAWLALSFPNAALVPATTEHAAFHHQLDEYFGGVREIFDFRINLVSSGFVRRVLEETRRIPYGATASYGEVAAAIGRPRAARAVGRALALNPLPIVIPCHRVVGKNGALVGFGGGLDLKEWLLAHERRVSSSLRRDSVPV